MNAATEVAAEKNPKIEILGLFFLLRVILYCKQRVIKPPDWGVCILLRHIILNESAEIKWNYSGGKFLNAQRS